MVLLHQNALNWKSPKFKATHVKKDPKDPWAEIGPLCRKNGGPAGRRPNKLYLIFWAQRAVSFCFDYSSFYTANVTFDNIQLNSTSQRLRHSPAWACVRWNFLLKNATAANKDFDQWTGPATVIHMYILWGREASFFCMLYRVGSGSKSFSLFV